MEWRGGKSRRRSSGKLRESEIVLARSGTGLDGAFDGRIELHCPGKNRLRP